MFGRRSFIWLPSSIVKRMILKINKSDYEMIIKALVIASEIESNANTRRKYNLARKKIKRQTK